MAAATLQQLYEDARARVQRGPADFAARSALWQILAAQGEFDRAARQLDVLVELDSSWAMEVAACQAMLAAEQARLRVFRGEERAACAGVAPEWFGTLQEAVSLLARADTQAAAPLLAAARDASEAHSGVLDGRAFSWLCDGDARIAPCLEVFARDKYLWLPWERVQRVAMRPPSEVRDHLWQAALVTLRDGESLELFIPVRYPAPRDESEAMSRITRWEPLGEDVHAGFGQKTLLTDGGDTGFLDVRELLFELNDVRDRCDFIDANGVNAFGDANDANEAIGAIPPRAHGPAAGQ